MLIIRWISNHEITVNTICVCDGYTVGASEYLMVVKNLSISFVFQFLFGTVPRYKYGVLRNSIYQRSLYVQHMGRCPRKFGPPFGNLAPSKT